MPVAVSKEHEVINRRLTGESVVEIARALGCSDAAVHQTLGKPDVKARIAEAQTSMLDDVKAKATATATEAMDTLLDIMRGNPGEDGKPAPDCTAAVRLKAATEALDRVGFVKGSDLHVTHESGPGGVKIDLIGLTTEALSALAYPPEDDD